MGCAEIALVDIVLHAVDPGYAVQRTLQERDGLVEPLWFDVQEHIARRACRNKQLAAPVRLEIGSDAVYMAIEITRLAGANSNLPVICRQHEQRVPLPAA